MLDLPQALYFFLFFATLLAPLRWSLVSFLVLSTIDMGSVSARVGLLNTAKAFVLPVYLLWRLRAYAGHRKVAFACIAWGLFVLYVGMASTWSLYPAYAIKLIGHMLASLLIAMTLIRASKGGYLSPSIIVPVSVGAIAIAAMHWFFLHRWGGETERFTSFSGAQAFAAFLAALYCAALCARSIRVAVRVPLSVALASAVLLNGSRIWIIGMLASTLLSILVSNAKTWLKIVTLGVTLVSGVIGIGEFDTIMEVLAVNASSNRIAAAMTAAYEGNFKSSGLGTYNLRHELYRRTLAGIESGTVVQLIFGHGTCNGAAIAETLAKSPDPNRAMHDEWLRAMYEWGLTGLLLWIIFIGSLFFYTIQGVRTVRGWFAKPLLIYLPAFTLGLTGENIIAGAANAMSVGFLLLLAFASISHRAALNYAYPARNRARVQTGFNAPYTYPGSETPHSQPQAS
jgi:hypothetical protein